MSNVQNVRRKPVLINLSDGTQREIKFTLNSFALLEEKYGSVEEGIKAMEKGSISAIRYMLYAGLSHSDDNLTEKQVGNLIEIHELTTLTDKMNEVMMGDLPAKDETAPNV